MSNGTHDSLIPALHLLVCSEGDTGQVSALAQAVQQVVRGNVSGEESYLATVCDLPVPIRNFSQCPSDLPPGDLLDQALHTLVVILVDESLYANSSWSSWIEACENHVANSNGRHQIIALCLTDELKQSYTVVEHQPTRYTVKISYDERQNNGEYAFGEYAERTAWFTLYVLQACRHLLASTIFDARDDAEKLKLKLFISHAKKDSLPLANSLRSALDRKEYFKSWYDAEDLAGVDDWRGAIREGVSTSVVVVLRTEKYDTRPWCRQEFIWADQCAVPTVCVEARNALELSGDTLAASRMPTVRIPDGNLFRVLFLALKESLRILQLERWLMQQKATHAGVSLAQECFLIPYTPTLRNLAHAAKVIREKRSNSTVGFNIIMYADPPLTPELYQASKTYIQQECGKTYLITPSLLPFWSATAATASRTPKDLKTRSLRRQEVNISISEHAPDLKRLGLSTHEVNGFVAQMAQALIANEAVASFGHDWRSNGVMQEVYRFAEEHQDVVLAEEERKGLVRNYCYWGYEPELNARERAHLRGVLDIIECSRPNDRVLNKFKRFRDVPPELRPYACARALTNMRRTITKTSFARVCLGGRDMDPKKRDDRPKGRCPGVAEEALLSCLDGKPLYLSALMGGVTEQIIEAIEGRDARFHFELSESVASIFIESGFEDMPDLPLGMTDEQMEAMFNYDGPLSSDQILVMFRAYGIERLAEKNGLSAEENRHLFTAGTIDEVIGWVLTGLARLCGNDQAGVPVNHYRQ